MGRLVGVSMHHFLLVVDLHLLLSCLLLEGVQLVLRRWLSLVGEERLVRMLLSISLSHMAVLHHRLRLIVLLLILLRRLELLGPVGKSLIMATSVGVLAVRLDKLSVLQIAVRIIAMALVVTAVISKATAESSALRLSTRASSSPSAIPTVSPARLRASS